MKKIAIYKLITYWKSSLVYLLILYISLLYTPKTPPVLHFPLQDKLVHFCMYFVLTMVFYLDLQKLQHIKKRFVYILAIPILFGGLIEILQGCLTTNRTADLLDFFANCSGIILAFLFMHFFVYRNKRN